ncbi:ABC transporter substrate-binding protein [Vibrio sinaloensis]|uniref:ABC transporter substrate-binding protein n=1 Tax=Photobacterium sp. (strain ATCC 43367) TaxID=379097 RepID=UPI0035ECC626
MRWLIVLCLFALPTEATRVLLIESYHSEYEWDRSYLEGLTETLQPGVELETFQMNTKRIPPTEYPKMAELAFLKYLEFKPEIVILGDDNALKYMWPKIYEDPISVVFLGVNANPRKVMMRYRGRAQITGVLERPLFVKTLGELKRFLPNNPLKVRIMFDSGATSDIARQHIERQYNLIRSNLGVEVEIVAASTREQWRKHILSAPQEGVSAVIVGLYQTLIDAKGNSVPADEIITWTNQHSSLPVFAFWDFAVDKQKAAGGVVLFGKSQGVAAGSLVNKIIDGESAKNIPIIIGNQGNAIYSKAAMEKWGLVPPSHWHPID